jgi:hypothetical protein
MAKAQLIAELKDALAALEAEYDPMHVLTLRRAFGEFRQPDAQRQREIDRLQAEVESLRLQLQAADRDGERVARKLKAADKTIAGLYAAAKRAREQFRQEYGALFKGCHADIERGYREVQALPGDIPASPEKTAIVEKCRELLLLYGEKCDGYLQSVTEVLVKYVSDYEVCDQLLGAYVARFGEQTFTEAELHEMSVRADFDGNGLIHVILKEK